MLDALLRSRKLVAVDVPSAAPVAVAPLRAPEPLPPGPPSPGHLVTPSPCQLSTRPASNVMRHTGTVEDASQEAVALARAKAALCAEAFRLKQESRISLPLAVEQLAATGQIRFALVHHNGRKGKTGINYPSVRKWMEELGRDSDGRPQAGNWARLLPDYGREYHPPFSIEFEQLVLPYILDPRQHQLSWIHRHAVATYNALPISRTHPAPSYDQLRTFVDHIDPAALHLAWNGSRVHGEMVLTPIRRDCPERPGDVFVGDHHTLDFWGRGWDEADGTWYPCRFTLTAWMDWSSWSVPGWEIRARAGNHEVIEHTLRAAVVANGNHPPVSLLIDNGKDFKKVAGRRQRNDWEHWRDAADSIGRRLGCNVVFTAPYKGQEKIVERFFREVHEKFSKMYPTYCGSGPDTRPDYVEGLKKNLMALPTVEDVRTAFAGWLHVFHATPSRGGTCAGRTPYETWNARRPINAALTAEELREAFMHLEGEYTVQKGGAVTVKGIPFVSPALVDYLLDGQRVRVKTDPQDALRASAYTREDRKICDLTLVPSFHWDGGEATSAAIAAYKEPSRQAVRDTKQDVAEAQGRTSFSNLPVGATWGRKGTRLQVAAARAAAATAQAVPSESADPDQVADFAAVMAAATQRRLATVTLSAETEKTETYGDTPA